MVMPAMCLRSGLQTRSRSCRSQRDGVVCNAKVKFSLKQKVEYGDKLCLVGNHKQLGRWDLDKAPELSWNDGDVWTGEIELPTDTNVEFKVVTVKGIGEPEWEDGSNRKLNVNGEPVSVDLSEPRAAPKTDSRPSMSERINASSSMDSDFMPMTAWQGKNVSFMQSNEHTKDRSGQWDTTGLEGRLLELVQGDEKSGSWLQKLDVAKELIVDKSKDMRPDLDILAPVFVYLQWISTGSIECVEGGGHFRPNRHAELSRIMFRSLEWVAGDNARLPMERVTARRMQAKLPSFSESFTASVPLTRIRDIAHRNDIPSDLKKEIKHTLQNKLHRNAGPEDLVATEAMLERITAHGTNYSGGFVDEFKTFTAELRDFFNAGSLTDNLYAIKDGMDESGSSVVQRFMDAKGSLDGKGSGASLNDIVDCMHQLTSVRSLVVAELASGLRNDAPDSALAGRQRWRLADLRCEDYAFVLASRAANAIEADGNGAAHLAGSNEKEWALPLGMLVLSVRHMGLSGWMPAECMAIDEEITAWQKAGLALKREDTMRLRASLQRCKRMTDSFAQAQLDAFAGTAKSLGKALGLSDDVTTIFAEAEIRANVAFQLSRNSALLLRACRGVLQAADYDGLVLGSATGILMHAASIEPGMQLKGDKPVVLLVDSATGDEEITTAGRTIKGVILCQDLPHLSHLGVRARQERVAFATCTSDDVIDSAVSPLVGRPVTLTVTADNVSIVEASDADVAPESTSGAAPSPSSAERADVKRVSKATVVPLKDAAADTCGAKAAACGRLVGLAAASGGLYSAAAGAVLPFGCLEAAAATAGVDTEFKKLRDTLQGAAVGAELDSACAQLQTLVRERCKPDDATLKELRAALPGSGVVIARSSANVEDLEGLSGAGLYESIPNLEAGNAESLAKGIAGVWASLFSRRAVLSRRSAGISEADACMAVLVQEMLAPELSFVLHTADPMTGTDGSLDSDSVYAELAPGLGETLASGAEGSAWRMSIPKAGGDLQMYAFANFGDAYLPAGAGMAGLKPGMSIYGSLDAETNGAAEGTVRKQVVDYSKQELSTSEEARATLGTVLAQVGVEMESAFGGAQDVEGAVKDGTVYVVQSRPQP